MVRLDSGRIAIGIRSQSGWNPTGFRLRQDRDRILTRSRPKSNPIATANGRDIATIGDRDIATIGGRNIATAGDHDIAAAGGRDVRSRSNSNSIAAKI